MPPGRIPISKCEHPGDAREIVRLPPRLSAHRTTACGDRFACQHQAARREEVEPAQQATHDDLLRALDDASSLADLIHQQGGEVATEFLEARHLLQQEAHIGRWCSTSCGRWPTRSTSGPAHPRRGRTVDRPQPQGKTERGIEVMRAAIQRQSSHPTGPPATTRKFPRPPDRRPLSKAPARAPARRHALHELLEPPAGRSGMFSNGLRQ
jgi:hypothetical protein